jgi:hypothetical protein
VVNDRKKYQEWEFVYDIKKDKTTGVGQMVQQQQNILQGTQSGAAGTQQNGLGGTGSGFGGVGANPPAQPPTQPPPNPPNQ